MPSRQECKTVGVLHTGAPLPGEGSAADRGAIHVVGEGLGHFGKRVRVRV